MFRLRSVGVLSCAKVFAVIHAVIGILIGFFVLVFGIIGAALAPAHQKFGAIGIIVLAALSPAFYGVIGFVIGALWAFVYNLTAQFSGGLELQLDAEPATQFVAPPAATPGTV